MTSLPMPAPAPHVYEASIVRPHDGDTFTATLRLTPWNICQTNRLRLAGLNAPELTTPAGIAAAQYTAQWLGIAANGALWPLIVVCPGLDDYGRILSIVYRAVDGACLNDDLLKSGNAVVMKTAAVAGE